MYFVLFVVITLRCVFCEEYPRGHKKPLGSHTKPGNIEVLDDFPTPVDFYHNYVKIGRPVLFKSVMDSGFPAFQKWTDAYLKKTYGREEVDVEAVKKENREGELTKKTFSRFLDTYDKDDIYMVQDIFPKMMNEIGIPRCLQCGGFQKQITTSVLWFSGGDTRSVLHFDTYDNINCLLDGTKDLVMFDKAYHDEIEANDFVEEGSYSRIDVDSVDLYKTPHFSYLPWLKATMTKGDCLYIPWRWYHQVNSFEKRNFAVNVWFNHLYLFNDTDCDGDIEMKTFKPLNTFKMAPLTEVIRHLMLSCFSFIPSITRNDLEESWGHLPDLFDSLDVNMDSLISWDELYKFDVQNYITKYGKHLTGLGELFWNEIEHMLRIEAHKGYVGSSTMLNVILDIKKNIHLTDRVTPIHSSRDEF